LDYENLYNWKFILSVQYAVTCHTINVTSHCFT
jgi:hypothetical protein